MAEPNICFEDYQRVRLLERHLRSLLETLRDDKSGWSVDSGPSIDGMNITECNALGPVVIYTRRRDSFETRESRVSPASDAVAWYIQEVLLPEIWEIVPDYPVVVVGAVRVPVMMEGA